MASLFLSACTVAPLETSGRVENNSSAFTGVALSHPNERVEQLVYNALLELGASNSDNGDLILQQTISQTTAQSALRPRTSSATIGSVTIISKWKLVSRSSGKVIGTGRAQGVASYDLFGQEAANMQALEEAQKRAAKELALRLRPMVLRAKSNSNG